MDIHEASERFRVSIGKLRKMEKAGILRLDVEDERVGKIRAFIGKGQPLPVLELVALVENPDLLFELGDRADAAHMQVATLGRCQDEAAAPAIVALVDQAAKDEPAAVSGLIDWICETLPARGEFPHAYLAARLVLGAGENLRPYVASRVARAFLNCRKREEFAGWWSIKPVGKRRLTFYHRGAKKAFDL